MSTQRNTVSTQSGPAAGSPARLAALTWSHLLNDGASNYLPGILPAVLVALGEPVQLAGGLIAAMTLGQGLQPVAGWLADRVGGRSLVVCGLLLSSVGGGLLGFAHATWAVIALLLLIGTGSALFHPQALSGVRSMAQGRQGLIMSMFLVGGELGRGIWPTVASFVVARAGLESLWIIAVPGLLTAPLLFRLAPRLPVTARKGGKVVARHHAKPMTLLIAYRSIQALATSAVVTFVPILWSLRGGSLVSGASIITTMLVVGVVGNLWGGHLADRFGRRSLLVVASLATAALVLPVAYLTSAPLWVAAGLLGIALFLPMSTTILIGQDIFPENRSMGSGIALGLANAIGAVLVLLVGLWVSDDRIVVVFWVVAVLACVAAALALLMPAHLMRAHTDDRS